MFTTIMMPKCTGSMPSFMATGNRMGARISTMDAGLHEVAGQQQQDVHRQQEADHAQPLPSIQSAIACGMFSLVMMKAEQHRVGDDVQQHRAHVGRVEQQHLGHVLQAHVLVDEHRDDEGVHRAHGRRLGGREDAGVDAAHHDDDQQQAPDRFAEGLASARPSWPWAGAGS
jgi:hypothetical protein